MNIKTMRDTYDPAFDVACRMARLGFEVEHDTNPNVPLDSWVLGDVTWLYSPMPTIDGKPYGLKAMLVAHRDEREVCKVEWEGEAIDIPSNAPAEFSLMVANAARMSQS